MTARLAPTRGVFDEDHVADVAADRLLSYRHGFLFGLKLELSEKNGNWRARLPDALYDLATCLDGFAIARDKIVITTDDSRPTKERSGDSFISLKEDLNHIGGKLGLLEFLTRSDKRLADEFRKVLRCETATIFLRLSSLAGFTDWLRRSYGRRGRRFYATYTTGACSDYRWMHLLFVDAI